MADQDKKRRIFVRVGEDLEIELCPGPGGWDWQATRGGFPAEALAARAALRSATYSYSPADGEPGRRLAAAVARSLGGTVAVTGPPPPHVPGRVY